MAAGDTQEVDKPAAGEAPQDSALEQLREPEAAGEQTASDHAPVSPAPSLEEEEADVHGGAEQEDERGPQEGWAEEEGHDAEMEGEEEKEEAPTHLPFAPPDELPVDTTTVDPTYTLSLIRKLIPQGPNADKKFSAKQDIPEERGANSDDEKSTQPASAKSDDHGFQEEKSVNADDGKSKQPDNEDPWEESGCILWDLASSKPQAELMMENLILEVLMSNLHVEKSSRVKEICLGIMANLACHESLVTAICSENGLIATVVEQLFLDDTSCLSQAFRLLTAILQNSKSFSFSCAEALLPDKILSRILWIVGNTSSSALLEQGVEFISTVIDKQDLITVLIQPWLKVGLVDYATSLLATEIEKSPEERLDRSDCLDMILHFMEELSAIHSAALVMSSNDQLIELLVNMVKSPDTLEVAIYCGSVVIIIANILTDGKHLVPMLSHDLPLMEGLFDILPRVHNDNQARYALWCTLSRFLAQVQKTEMDSSSVDQFASLFLDMFALIDDDLERDSIDAYTLPVDDAYMKAWTSTCFRAISFVMERWITEKSSQREKDAPVTGNSIDDARELLSYCKKMVG